jgi:hypothetical protein
VTKEKVKGQIPHTGTPSLGRGAGTWLSFHSSNSVSLSLSLSLSLALKMDFDFWVLFVVVVVVASVAVCSSLSLCSCSLARLYSHRPKCSHPPPLQDFVSLFIFLCLLPLCTVHVPMDICLLVLFVCLSGVIVLAVVVTSAPLPPSFLTISPQVQHVLFVILFTHFVKNEERRKQFRLLWITNPTFHPQSTVNSFISTFFFIKVFPFIPEISFDRRELVLL